MPEFDLGVAEDRPPLFTDDDPLTFTLRDLDGKKHTFRCEDYPQMPDDSRGGISDRPKWYTVESLALQAVEDSQDAVRDMLNELWEARVINENNILDLVKHLNSERRKAEKRAMSRKTRGRPTSEPSGSTS